MGKDEDVKGDFHDLKALMSTPERDYLLRNDAHKVPLSQIEGKMVALYFSNNSLRWCHQFTRVLAEIYTILKERGENFEVVSLSFCEDENDFNHSFQSMPWLAVPFGDNTCEELSLYFNIISFPTLFIIDPEGKTIHSNACDIIEELGVDAYPFSPAKFAKFEEMDKEILESQSLKSLLISGELDFVMGKDEIKVPVSELVGKTILLYFSKKGCPPCQIFSPKLIEAYHEIKAKHDDFEVIYISFDDQQEEFEEYYLSMPWLAIPFGDKRENFLSRILNVTYFPYLIAISPTGQILTKQAVELIKYLGSNAFPFDNECLKKMETHFLETAKGLPEKLRHATHAQHELLRSKRSNYICDGCQDWGDGWAYYCEECDFDLHPKCALEENKGMKEDENEDHDSHRDCCETNKDGWKCNGEVCHRI